MTRESIVERPIGWGDRMPNFVLPDLETDIRDFYRKFEGFPAVVIFFSTRPDTAGPKLFLECIRRADEFRRAGARVVGINADSRRASRDIGVELPDHFDILTDADAQVHRGYACPPGENSVFVADRNQRIYQRFDQASEGAVDAALQMIATIESMETPREIAPIQAPVLIVRRVFDPEFCAELIEAWRHDHKEGQVVQGTGNESDRTHADHVKKRLDHVVSREHKSEIFHTLARRLMPEVKKYYQFLPVEFQTPKVVAYEASRKDFFRPHRDNTVKGTQKRRFAVSLNLNDDYEGGELRFPEYGDALYRPPAGGAIVFSTEALHEATPVTKGVRYAMLTFLNREPVDLQVPQEAARKR